MNRWRDWWDQADRDIKHGGHAVEDGDHEWAAFAAQQAAGKTLKALIAEAASHLDKHYIPTRYPNGFASGYPGKLYTRSEAEGALEDGSKIIEFCRRHLP